MTSKILVVEDTADVRNTLRDTLKDKGYSVSAVSNESDAIVAISSEQFEFALIDVRLHDGGEEDQSGLSLAMAIHALSPGMRIIMLSRYICSSHIVRAVRYHGAIDFIDKGNPDWLTQLLQAISEAERAAIEQPKSKGIAKHASHFSYSLIPDRPVVIRSRGRHVCTVITPDILQLDVDDYSEMEQMARKDFKKRRYHIGKIGEKLWNDIFHNHFDAETAYLQANTKSQILSLQFEMPRELSGLPLEFVRANGKNEFLILQHPFSRLLIGATPNCETISPNLLTFSDKLRVLLIASNTNNSSNSLPPIPGVDDEINQLNVFLTNQKYCNVEIKILPTKLATLERIRDELKETDFDIIHYAGHGLYDPASPEESSIFFWDTENPGDDPLPMTATELKLLLDQSNVRFMYLSCCYGTAAGDKTSLLDDDFVGLADAVVQAGVPSVLGYRWPVSDSGAVKLASAFYRSLLEQGSIDVALWQARRELAVNRNDPTWLSPILIHQV